MQVEIEQFIYWLRMRNPYARTWRDYRCDLHLFQSRVGDMNILEIRPQHLDGFIKFQISKGYKPSTVNRRLAAIVSLYRFLIREGKAMTCPVLPKRHYLREPQRLPRPVNEIDLRKYFGCVHDVRDRAMFTLMLRCGLRIGEVAELKVTDLYLGEAPSRMIIHGKGSRERTVFLSSETEQCIQHWLARRPSARDEHVFLSYQHRKLSTTSINVRINDVRRISGVDLTAHRLRHTFADHLLSAGMPITSIQKLMGHRFVETTQNYAIANDKQVQADFYKACEKLEGWTLLLESTQGMHPKSVRDLSELQEVDTQDTPAISTVIPESFCELPPELVLQLESYRQLRANRWRIERLAANSVLYYSQYGILWKFFCGQCGVGTASDLKLDHVLEFVRARLDTGRSARTINGSLSSLRSFLSFLKEDGISIDPSLENIQRLKESEHLPRYITAEQVFRMKREVDRLASSLTDPFQRYDALLLRAIFYLLWQGGLRSGEVELLRFSDFYISEGNEAKRLFIRDGKWRKGRAVYLTDVALDALKAYLAVRGVEQPGDLVFVRMGMPLKKNYVSQQIRKVGMNVDVKVSPHRLRHTFATQLLNVGCKVTSIQKLLGHTNLNTTMTYARAFDQTVMLDFFQAVGAIESELGGAWFGLNELHIDEPWR
jgi:site-specific recombinase XerD